MSLKLFGHMVSQPTRAAAWLMQVKKLPYELVLTKPPANIPPSFLKMNPNNLVPVLQDGDFSMFEGNAIMAYLANKHDWTDVYPKDAKARAKIDQYLSWHHTNTRHSTTRILRPYIARHLGKATPEQLDDVKNTNAIISRYVTILEQLFVAPYVAESKTPTLADYACYCELDQLEAMEVFDFSVFPKTAAWMERMKEVPLHDEVRVPMNDFLTSVSLKPAPKP